jgi:hypothetical protein
LEKQSACVKISKMLLGLVKECIAEFCLQTDVNKHMIRHVLSIGFGKLLESIIAAMHTDLEVHT